MSLRIGRSWRHMRRYRQILGISLRYGFGDVVDVARRDLIGRFGDQGVWAKSALFLPENMTYTSVTSPDETQEQRTLDNELCFRYVVGEHCAFKNGVYINAQYLHGYLRDGDADNLEDYLLIAIEKKPFHEGLKGRTVFVAEVANFSDFTNRSASYSGPEITYHLMDNVELVAGSFMLGCGFLNPV